MANDKEDQNGFESSGHGLRENPKKSNPRRIDTERYGVLDESALLYRIEQLEDHCRGLETFSDELRLGQNTRTAQIKTLQETATRHETELVLTRAHEVEFATSVNTRIDELRSSLTERIDAVKDALTTKIDHIDQNLSRQMNESKAYNSKWFIVTLSTLLTSVVVIIVTRVWTG